MSCCSDGKNWQPGGSDKLGLGFGIIGSESSIVDERIFCRFCENGGMGRFGVFVLSFWRV